MLSRLIKTRTRHHAPYTHHLMELGECSFYADVQQLTCPCDPIPPVWAAVIRPSVAMVEGRFYLSETRSQAGLRERIGYALCRGSLFRPETKFYTRLSCSRSRWSPPFRHPLFLLFELAIDFLHP